MPDRQTLDISSGTILRAVFVVLALLFLWFIRDVLVLLFFAIIVAAAVAPVVSELQKIKIPRILGALLVYLAALGFLVLVVSLTAPTLANEFQFISDKIPEFSERLSVSVEQAGEFTSDYYDITDELQGFLSSIQGRLVDFASNSISTTFSIFGGVASFIMVIVISFYLAVQKSGIQNFLRAITPREHETYVVDFWSRVERRIGKWFQGQLFLALVVGFLVFAGLSVLGIQYSLILGILAGILELIPFVGPVLAAIPAVFLGFLQSALLGVSVLILYFIIQQIESQILLPKVMQKAVGLNPVIVILAMLVGVKLGGMIGIIISVPLTAIVAEFFEDVAEAKKRTFKEVEG